MPTISFGGFGLIRLVTYSIQVRHLLGAPNVFAGTPNRFSKCQKYPYKQHVSFFISTMPFFCKISLPCVICFCQPPIWSICCLWRCTCVIYKYTVKLDDFSSSMKKTCIIFLKKTCRLLIRMALRIVNLFVSYELLIRRAF